MRESWPRPHWGGEALPQPPSLGDEDPSSLKDEDPRPEEVPSASSAALAPPLRDKMRIRAPRRDMVYSTEGAESLDRRTCKMIRRPSMLFPR